MKFILSFISVLSVFWIVPEGLMNSDSKYIQPSGTEILEQNRNGKSLKTLKPLLETKKVSDEDDADNPPLEPIHFYTNSFGQEVQAPKLYAQPPANATARCRDGEYSFSKNRRGTCSGHGRVAEWLE